jgi:hypothetical protein
MPFDVSGKRVFGHDARRFAEDVGLVIFLSVIPSESLALSEVEWVEESLTVSLDSRIPILA